MAKFNEIKVGDIVCHDGQVARVMEKVNISMENPHPIIRIVGPTIDSRLHPTNVQLMEAIELPQLKVGDRVHVNDIPKYERPRTDGIWLPDMDDFIGKDYIVKELWDHPQLGHLAKLDDWWFRVYHLSEISKYDMI